MATNLDATYHPIPGGLLPGAGAIVAANLAIAPGTSPEVAGKPSPAMAALGPASARDPGLVVGDRPSTDGALAQVLGWPSSFVLSG